MICRLGVTSHLRGGELGYEPKKYGLVTVYSVDAKGYRQIPLDNILDIIVAGRIYKIQEADAGGERAKSKDSSISMPGRR